MPANGGFKCVDGAYFNSRCEYYCSPGYTLKGERTVTCLDSKAWSGPPASCVGKKMPQPSDTTDFGRDSGIAVVDLKTAEIAQEKQKYPACSQDSGLCCLSLAQLETLPQSLFEG